MDLKNGIVSVATKIWKWSHTHKRGVEFSVHKGQAATELMMIIGHCPVSSNRHCEPFDIDRAH
jgi:hypothetical protein